MKKVYIYGLIDPRTDNIRYVGKTIDLKNRIKYHFNPHKTDRNSHKKNWINNLKLEGLKPEMIILDEIECVGKEWVIYEKYWISQARTWGFNLTNYSDGGDDPPINKGWSKEGRAKLIEINKYRRIINVYYNDVFIGQFDGINNFIRDYMKLDRYENKREFNSWSSKISAIINGKRKSYKNYKFELVC